MGVRCRGYKQRPVEVYRPGTYIGRYPIYGLGKCPECGRVIALSPKAQTIVCHKRELAENR